MCVSVCVSVCVFDKEFRDSGDVRARIHGGNVRVSTYVAAPSVAHEEVLST